jgi:hypothetical protein
MDARHLAEGIAPLWLVAAALAPLEPGTRGTPTDSPDSLMQCLETSYESRDVGEYGKLFTADFRYFFGDAELARRYPDGWTREDEIASARHLFEGFRDAGGVYRPPATRISLTLTPMSIRPDPDRPDSADWYRLAIVPAVRLEVATDDGNFFVENDRHDFWLVRGDAACLSGGQAADAEHWYIRRWVEKPRSALADASEGGPAADPGAGQAIGTRAAQPGVALGTRAAPAIDELRPNPAQETLALAFTLPARSAAHVLVVDAAGRIRYRRSLGALEPGVHRVALALGRELGPGIYWVQLVAGNRSDSRRVVLIP